VPFRILALPARFVFLDVDILELPLTDSMKEGKVVAETAPARAAVRERPPRKPKMSSKMLRAGKNVFEPG
jgi:hypothetical protein